MLNRKYMKDSTLRLTSLSNNDLECMKFKPWQLSIIKDIEERLSMHVNVLLVPEENIHERDILIDHLCHYKKNSLYLPFNRNINSIAASVITLPKRGSYLLEQPEITDKGVHIVHRKFSENLSHGIVVNAQWKAGGVNLVQKPSVWIFTQCIQYIPENYTIYTIEDGNLVYHCDFRVEDIEIKDKEDFDTLCKKYNISLLEQRENCVCFEFD